MAIGNAKINHWWVWLGMVIAIVVVAVFGIRHVDEESMLAVADASAAVQSANLREQQQEATYRVLHGRRI